MTKKLVFNILGGFLGFIAGAFLGGYLGLILGGTFLGGFDIYEMSGFEGYELAMYVGALLGGLIFIGLGIRFANKCIQKPK
jgi:hypothetical protein